MSMTHYMQLLADHQPWNLLTFMAVPVILAETVAISELYLLFTRDFSGWVAKLSRVAGSIVGIYFLGVTIYLLQNAVVPITMAGEWRGIADVLAVGFYLSGVVPLVGIGLIDLGLLLRGRKAEAKLKVHATLVGVFLVVAHVAMIFGMLDPAVLGFTPDAPEMPMEMGS